MVDKSRRSFFNDFFVKTAVKCASESIKAYEDAKNDLAYFDSFESAYPLISETYDFLEDEAKRLGVDMKGMNKLEIIKEIYRRDKNHH